MTTKELIRKKFADLYMEYKEKFHQTGDSYFLGIIDGLDMTNRVLNTLPDEPVADCNEFEEAKEEYIRKARRTPGHEWMTHDIEDAFKAGAEWQKRKIMGDSLEKPTCKSCGFYENDCPFIRGKFMPYPNIVCKDYTSSIIRKEEEQ